MYKYQNVEIGEVIPCLTPQGSIQFFVCVEEHKNKYTPPKCPSTLYHYTNTQSFEKIISSKKLFLSHLWETNDSSEIKWFLNLVKNEIRKYSFNANLFMLFELIEKHRWIPYYFSFSEKKDSINQWVKYGDNGLGISIGFSSKALGLNKMLPVIGTRIDYNKISSLLKIDYAERRQKKLIQDILNSVVKQKIHPANAAFYLSKMAFATKNPEWEDEKEWRIVYPYTDHSITKGNETLFSFPKTVVNGKGVLKNVCEMTLSESYISEVVIGPKSNIKKEDIAEIFQRNGVNSNNHITICHSNSSLR